MEITGSQAQNPMTEDTAKFVAEHLQGFIGQESLHKYLPFFLNVIFDSAFSQYNSNTVEEPEREHTITVSIYT